MFVHYFQEEERRLFSEAQRRQSRPSSVFHELDFRKVGRLGIGESVLGQVGVKLDNQI